MSTFVGLLILVQLVLVSSHKHLLFPFRNSKQTNDKINRNLSMFILNSSAQRPHGKSEILIGYNDAKFKEHSISNKEDSKVRKIKANRDPAIQQPLYRTFLPYRADLPEMVENDYAEIKFKQVESVLGNRGTASTRDDPIRVEITDMQCDNDTHDGGFRAIIKLKSNIDNTPVIEDTENAVGDRSCDVQVESPNASNAVVLRVNIVSELFSVCGVRECSTGEHGSRDLLCLRLRFPTIHNLRLVEDPILTLQCKTRDAIVTNTKTLYMPVKHRDLSPRTSGTIAVGGADYDLHPQVVLFRRPQGLSIFSQMVQPEETILLGEELMLKVTLDSKQGWAFSRMGNIALIRGEDSATILDNEGCVNSEMRPICPLGPVEQTPLVHSLLMRAATFRSTNEEEMMKLSVQILACLKRNDCTSTCADNHGRYQRDTRLGEGDSDNQVPVWNTTAELSFRVIPSSAIATNNGTVFNNGRLKGTTLCLAVALIACAVMGLFGIFRCYRKANTRHDYSYDC